MDLIQILKREVALVYGEAPSSDGQPYEYGKSGVLKTSHFVIPCACLLTNCTSLWFVCLLLRVQVLTGSFQVPPQR